ncbi:MAG TPA: alpha,alpha-trehalase TreF [Chitinophagaceae bacterium]|jgi:alpha,alpha-trehalase|nr:alpha,alpha-trehalase TreF [Chitinophagaceae bacterium]
MKKFISILLAFVVVFNISAQQQVQTPAEIYGELFTDVQMRHIFPDSKTFPDCIPKRDPKEIVKDYLTMKNNPAIRFRLDEFVTGNFDLPKTPQLNYITKEKDVVMHIKNLWNVLKREADSAVNGSSLLPLPNAYIVPGGRFREIYYWDSYFTMLGLKESGEVEMIENMVKNFAYLIYTYGHIPNGNRSYYISRSQPPFFSLMVDLLASIKGDDVYPAFLPALEKEYNFWMEGGEKLKPGQSYRRVVKMKDGVTLNRYWDDAATPRPEGFKEDVATAEKSGRNKEEMYRNLRAGAESGIDFSSRWFADKKNITTIEVINTIPVDLNSLLLSLEYTISKAKKLSGDALMSSMYLQKATKRSAAIDKYCWNKQLNYYTDYDFKKQKQNGVVTPAGMYPFCIFKKTSALNQKCTLATSMLKRKLLKAGGIQTTENNTGQQWDAPNGWAPLEWMTIWGLERCGQSTLARDIAQRWVKLNADVFQRTGKLMEKYNVADTHLEAGGGEYGGQDGFGWTNGVLLALINKYQLHPND